MCLKVHPTIWTPSQPQKFRTLNDEWVLLGCGSVAKGAVHCVSGANEGACGYIYLRIGGQFLWEQLPPCETLNIAVAYFRVFLNLEDEETLNHCASWFFIAIASVRHCTPRVFGTAPPSTFRPAKAKKHFPPQVFLKSRTWRALIAGDR